MRKFAGFLVALAVVFSFVEAAQAGPFGLFGNRRSSNNNCYTTQDHGFFTNSQNFYSSEQIFRNYYNSIPGTIQPGIIQSGTIQSTSIVRPGSIWIADENGILRPAPANFNQRDNRPNDNRPNDNRPNDNQRN